MTSVVLRGIFLFLLTGAVTSAWGDGDIPRVAAPSYLKFALADIAQQFKEETGHSVQLNFGLGELLFQQLENGEPYQLLLTSNDKKLQRLEKQGWLHGNKKLLALSRLALFAPKGSPLRVDAALQDLRAALSEGRVLRFAIANPDRTTSGRAAREVLIKAGLWDTLGDKLVVGENSTQVMNLATSGSCEGAIVYLAIAKLPDADKLGAFAPIPADWHAPMQLRAVLLKGAGDTARAFYDYLERPEIRAILTRYGLETPAK